MVHHIISLGPGALVGLCVVNLRISISKLILWRPWVN
jgi:hypothetical protein